MLITVNYPTFEWCLYFFKLLNVGFGLVKRFMGFQECVTLDCFRPSRPQTCKRNKPLCFLELKLNENNINTKRQWEKVNIVT